MRTVASTEWQSEPLSPTEYEQLLDLLFGGER